MDPKVVQFDTGKPVDGLVNEEPVVEVVEWLEQLLAEAQSGKLHALAMVAIDSQGRMKPGWAGGQAITPVSMVGAIEMLKVLFMREHQLV